MSIYINQALHEIVRTIRLAETVRGLRNVIDRNQIIGELNAFRTQLEDTRREVNNLIQTPEIQNNPTPEIIAAIQNWVQQYRGQITNLIDLIGNAGQANSMINLIQNITPQTAGAQLTALFNIRGLPARLPVKHYKMILKQCNGL